MNYKTTKENIYCEGTKNDADKNLRSIRQKT